MANSPRRDTPDPPPRAEAGGELPTAVHTAVTPGTAILRLETIGPREGGVLDGAWWPRSRRIHSELPGLISALARHIGPITRVGLDATAWDGLPTRLVVDGQVVRIDSYPVGDDTILVTRSEHDLFSLLVIPPDADAEAAKAAIAQAVRQDNVADAQQILIDTGAGQQGSV
ncbi:hypothetical protein KGQ20_14485 [Catenulispora sp. NF23]|uniref:DUF5994 family protein n=1 Tax=Catenulispora pinistramenti TaxID=2705254 RepID=UPI001BA71378|nr:DUF5994 family protein [Catenulispora pinistramenti]MBS2533979.1 hypothetical protein [Catenulispora pinistramenti]